MADDREAALDALLTLIQDVTFSAPINGATGWVLPDPPSLARRLRLWTDTPPEMQPAAYLVEHTESDEQRGLGLLRRTLKLELFCYCRTDDPAAVGATYLNQMLAALETALAADDPSHNVCTLGGLVAWVRISGDILKVPGDIDNQARMIVPLAMELP